MTSEHVQPEEEVHRLLFQYRKTARQECVSDFDLRQMHSTHNTASTHTLGNALVPLVDQSFYADTFAQSKLMIVCWAPLSTKALRG